MISLFALCLATLAGCLDDGPATDADAVAGEAVSMATELLPVLDAPLIIDDVRAGGEPVIAVLPSGTLLVSSHPGWTHLHPKDMTTAATDLLLPANAQSYLWRSTDGGETWDHVDLVDGVGNAPRSAALGVSDPEFTVMEDGTVCMTDLIALAESSVSCSTDDGQTWLVGNSVASQGPNDRQWLASLGDELYFTANYFVDHRIQASTDHGLTWEVRGDVPCSRDLIGDRPRDTLIVGCPDGISISEDRGFTWSERRGPEGDWGGQRIMAEPALDAAGNVWIVLTQGEDRVVAAGSPDLGESWPWLIDITPHFAAFAADNPHGAEAMGNGTYVWPWISAGSEGRFAVTWIGSYDDSPSSQQYGPWYVFSAFVVDATTTPQVGVVSLTPDPIHVQPICQDGTTCQVTSVSGDPAGDRRLGDFFETTIDAQGFLHAAWSNTAAEPDDVVSHAEYVHQSGGFRLLTDDDIGVFMPTQG